MTGQPLLREICREAARNVASGTSKALIALLAFLVGVGAIVVSQTQSLVALGQAAARWQEQGSSTYYVLAPGQINGAVCNALAKTAGINAAGAVRAAAPTRIAVLPSTDVQVFEATPGMSRVLRMDIPPGGERGVWLAEDLSAVVGPEKESIAVFAQSDEAGRVAPISAESVDAAISGIYPFPQDGRATMLAYSIISPVPPIGMFDSCWIEVWPENSTLNTYLLLAYDSLDPQATPPQIQQYNPTSGLTFGAQARLAALPIWPLTGAAVAFVGVLSYLLVRVRRLELASELHAGFSASSVLVQLELETLAWTLPAAAVLTPLIYLLAAWRNPGSLLYAAAPGWRTLALSVIVTYLVTAIAGLTIKERHLFKHFKQR